MDADKIYSSRFYCPFCETWSVHIEKRSSMKIKWWRADCAECGAGGPLFIYNNTPQDAADAWMKIVPEGIEIPESNTGILYGKLPEED